MDWIRGTSQAFAPPEKAPCCRPAFQLERLMDAHLPDGDAIARGPARPCGSLGGASRVVRDNLVNGEPYTMPPSHEGARHDRIYAHGTPNAASEVPREHLHVLATPCSSQGWSCSIQRTLGLGHGRGTTRMPMDRS